VIIRLLTQPDHAPMCMADIISNVNLPSNSICSKRSHQEDPHIDQEDGTILMKRSHTAKPLLIEHPAVIMLRRQHEISFLEREEGLRMRPSFEKSSGFGQRPEGPVRVRSKLLGAEWSPSCAS